MSGGSARGLQVYANYATYGIVKGVNSNPGDIRNCFYCAEAADERFAGNLNAVTRSGAPPLYRDIEARYPGRKFQSMLDPADIRQTILAGPEGSRGIVTVYYQDPSRLGHAFNVIKHKGGVYFVDAQKEVLYTNQDVRSWDRYFFLQTYP
jgi:hypothetical protein